MKKFLLGFALAIVLTLSACGGGGSYSPPVKEEPPVVAPYGFDDAGVIQGKLRSDLPQGTGTTRPLTLQYDTNGCKFPSDAANSIMFGCPGYRDAKPKVDGAPGWSGNLQQRLGCGGDTATTGDTWVGCLHWTSDNFFSLNSPGDTYWVTVINNDPAYDQCNPGPPGASNRLGTLDSDATFKTGVAANQIVLEANAYDRRTNGEWLCYGTKQPRYSAPFFSVGAELGKGQGRPIMPLRTGQPYKLSWESRIVTNRPFGCAAGTEPACSDLGQGPGGGVWAGIYLTSKWAGVKRLLFVFNHTQGHLVVPEPIRKVNWSWPVAESFYYPGYEIGYLTTKHVRELCQINMPDLAEGPNPTAYSVDVAALMQCASDQGLFSQPLEASAELTGVHWFIEFTGTEGALRFTVENPQSK